MDNPQLNAESTGKPIRVYVGYGLLLTAVAVLLLSHSWQRWGDPLIDLGRDLYIAGALVDGEILYRTVLYNYGPLAPYLLATVVVFCGDSLGVFATVGLTIATATAWGLFAIGCRLHSGAVGFVCALLFVVFCLCPGMAYNFILPYSYAATLGTAAAVWSFYCLLVLRDRQDHRIAGTAAIKLLIMTLLCKQDIGLALLIAHAAEWITFRRWRHAAAASVAMVLTGAICLFLFHGRDGEMTLLADNLMRFSGNSLSLPFFQTAAGVDRWRQLLLLRIIDGMLIAALIAAVALPGAMRQRYGAPGWRLSWLAAVVIGGPLIVRLGRPDVFAVAVPAAVAVVALTWREARREPIFLLAVFILGSAIRLALNYYPHRYGFYLCVPVLPFAVYGLGVRAAELSAVPQAARALLGLVLIMAIIDFVGNRSTRLASQTAELVTDKGRMLDYPIGRAECIRDVGAYIRERETPPASMVVFPEGISLNYFFDIPNPMPWYLFIPPELPDTTDRRVADRLTGSPPDLVVMVERDVTEYGRIGFGLDYGLAITAWLKANYRIARTIVHKDRSRSAMIIWERK